jgi:hypothetical protein
MGGKGSRVVWLRFSLVVVVVVFTCRLRCQVSRSILAAFVIFGLQTLPVLGTVLDSLIIQGSGRL